MKINWNIAGLVLGLIGLGLSVLQSTVEEKQLQEELDARDQRLLEEINKSRQEMRRNHYAY